MTHELVADAEPPLVGRHRHQQVAAGPEPGGPRLYRGCVVFDVLEHLESADQVELTRFYVLDAEPRARPRRPADGHTTHTAPAAPPPTPPPRKRWNTRLSPQSACTLSS